MAESFNKTGAANLVGLSSCSRVDRATGWVSNMLRLISASSGGAAPFRTGAAGFRAEVSLGGGLPADYAEPPHAPLPL
jgi:hypothetical protein